MVDDGSTRCDGRSRARGRPPSWCCATHTNRGKGHAVRAGMLAARGELRLMTDADLSTPIEELARLEAASTRGFDVAIGSRAVAGPASRCTSRPTARRWDGSSTGWSRRCCCPASTTPSAASSSSRRPRPRPRLLGLPPGWLLFDVEALYVARRRGLRIAELPVVWRNDAATRVGLGGGAFAFLDLLRIRLGGGARPLRPPAGLSRPT